jgi:hypothetical protein
MYKYQIEDAYKNRPAIDLFKKYYPERSQYMVRLTRSKKIQYFIVAKDGDETVGAMGISDHKDGVFTLSYEVTHPDHRQKFIANSTRYLGLKFCFESGAEIVGMYREKHIVFSKERILSMGFTPIEVIGKNKHINRKRKELGMSQLPVRYNYELRKEDFPWEKVNRICKIIESGRQQEMIKN